MQGDHRILTHGAQGGGDAGGQPHKSRAGPAADRVDARSEAGWAGAASAIAGWSAAGSPPRRRRAALEPSPPPETAAEAVAAGNPEPAAGRSPGSAPAGRCS